MLNGPYAKHGVLVRVAYLVVSSIVHLAQRLVRVQRGTIVLCYHAVTDSQRPSFERQMRLVAQRSPLQAEDLFATGGAEPGLRILVTFDDAFECLRENAFPIMRTLDVPATVFAVSGNLGNPPNWSMPPGHPEARLATMSAAAIVALRGDPLFSIGSHTLTHPPLATIEPALAETELFASRRDLESLTGRPIELLALPHGSVNPFVVGAARRAGYRLVFTLEPDITRGVPENGLVGRFGVSPDMWMSEFRLTIAGAYAWLGPWRRFVRRLRALLVWRRARGQSAAQAYSA